MVDANFVIESTLAERNAIQLLGPGLVTVIRAGEHAVQRRNLMSQESFDAVYGYIGPEIPFSSLETQ